MYCRMKLFAKYKQKYLKLVLMSEWKELEIPSLISRDGSAVEFDFFEKNHRLT